VFSGRISPRGRHGRRGARALVVAMAGALVATVPPAASAAVSPTLADRLASSDPGDRIAVVATLDRQVDGLDHEGRPAALLRALRRTAAATQPGVADAVEGPVRSFWLVNAIAFSGTPEEVRAVAADPAVDAVDLDAPVRIADAALAQAPFPDPGGGNWGLAATRVPAVCRATGCAAPASRSAPSTRASTRPRRRWRAGSSPGATSSGSRRRPTTTTATGPTRRAPSPRARSAGRPSAWPRRRAWSWPGRWAPTGSGPGAPCSPRPSG
jgi:hypothetical protein